MLGSWLFRNAVYIASKSLDITIIPLIAFFRSFRLLSILPNSLTIQSHSKSSRRTSGTANVISFYLLNLTIS